MAGTVYENFLKGEYAVENGDSSLIITKSSCYRVKEETVGLVEHLPAAGTREDFVGALAALGVREAGPIFDRLLQIGALRPRQPRSPRGLLRAVLSPDFRLVPAAWQEKFFRAAGLSPSGAWLDRHFRLVFALAAGGLLLSLAVSYTGLYEILAAASSGRPATAGLLGLVLLGSVIHELGHSYAAAAAGVAFRPIGISFYLFFPIFYANVSGMERLPFRAKAAIDLGGFFAQSVYLLLLLGLWAASKEALFLAAVKWTALIMVFNMNPLLKTDTYWLYRDFRKSRPAGGAGDWLHRLYLLAFAGFTLYLLRYAWQQAGAITALLSAAWARPALLLSDGYKLVLGLYLLLMFFTGGARRLEETRQEWRELRARTPSGA